MYKSCVFTFAIFCVVIFAQDQGYPQELQDCIKETGASEADVESFKGSAVPNTTKAACLVACMGKKFGMMHPNNTYNLEKALANVAVMKTIPVPPNLPSDLPDKMEQSFKTCKSQEVQNNDECQAAMSFAQCMENQRVALGLPDRPSPKQ